MTSRGIKRKIRFLIPCIILLFLLQACGREDTMDNSEKNTQIVEESTGEHKDSENHKDLVDEDSFLPDDIFGDDTSVNDTSVNESQVEEKDERETEITGPIILPDDVLE